jgi:hypothetical protein
MHPWGGFLRPPGYGCTQIRKKAFQIFTPHYLPSLFHTHHSGAPLDNPSLAVIFSTTVEAVFQKSVVIIIGWEYRAEQ